MRLVTYDAQGTPRVGVLHQDMVVDPAAVLIAGGHPRADSVASEMIAFLSSGSDGLAAAADAVELASAWVAAGRELESAEIQPWQPADGVALLAPVPRPRRMRDYLTYTSHASGSGITVPPAFTAMPICYKCNVESVIGPEQPLVWPSYTNQLDFELEVGFFIGSGGVDLTVSEAQTRIAGVTIFNDVSARDIQMWEMSLTIGPSKGKDFCSAMGPCILTMDEVDEWAIPMTARVNGELWASGTTAERQFSFAEVLAWASLDEPVYPGEFFAVGTVGGGCGLELDRWISPGDIVELEAGGVGVLRNPVGQPRQAPPGSGLTSFSSAPAYRV